MIENCLEGCENHTSMFNEAPYSCIVSPYLVNVCLLGISAGALRRQYSHNVKFTNISKSQTALTDPLWLQTEKNELRIILNSICSELLIAVSLLSATYIYLR